MTSKTISVTLDVYNLLKKMRLPGESFGDTIARLCKGKTSESLYLWTQTSEGWIDLTNEEHRLLDETLHDVQASFREERVDLS
ncbi:MAG: antitoxin VapB family protein [Candidatus Thorarchaeota archaeon]|nr:antitoxin VapB family protein [Candidatus Thorarchaeota archaeon]